MQTTSKKLHPDFIKEVKRRVDIVDVISEYVPLRKRGRGYMGCCPFHDENTPSFSVDPDKGLAHCFGCTWGGDAIKFLMEHVQISFTDAVLDQARKHNIPIRYADGSTDSNYPAPLPRKPQRKAQKPTPTPAPIPDTRELAKLLAAPVIHPEKRKRAANIEIEYPYSATQWVLRTEKPNPEKPKGYEKITLPYHLNEAEKAVNAKGGEAWPPYRMDEIKAYGAGSWVLGVEGESCVEAARWVGLVGFTLQGGSWSDKELSSCVAQIKEAGIAGIIYLPDHDDTGYKKAKEMAEAAAKAGMPFVQINPLEIWPECPDKGDIADWVKFGMEQGWSKEEFVAQIERIFNSACAIRAEEDKKIRDALVVADTPLSRFKNDLLALANSNDDLERLFKINEMASTYRMPASEIRKAIAKTEVATRTPKAQFLGVDDLLNLETEGIDYLIPGLLPRGETVLCVALPKAGKTLLSVDAAFAVATGESAFLGESVQQGKVLLVSVDESLQSTKLKLIKRGFRASDAKNMAIMTDWDISQMGELEARLEDFRPDLVIIDSLKRITAGRELSENSAEFADVIYTLKELLGRYGAAGILIHHSNKNQEAVGVSKVRGSTAITGACWGVWQLDHIIQSTDENGKPIKGKPKYDPTDPRRIFTAICRDAENQTKTIQFNPENHSFTAIAEDTEAQKERKTQEQRILELLSEYHPNGLSGREIMDELGLGRSVYAVLERMTGRKIVTHRQSKTDRRSMVYALPKKQNTHPPLQGVKMLTNFSESIAAQEIDNSQQLVNILPKNSQQPSLEEVQEVVLTNFSESIAAQGLDGSQCQKDGSKASSTSDEVDKSEPLPVNNYDDFSHQSLGVGGGVCVDDDAIAPQLAQEEANEHQKLPTLKVGDLVTIQAGGKFDGQIAVVTACENQDGELLVESESLGLKLWYRREFLLRSFPQGD